MKLINQQKLIIGVSALAVVVLVTTTIWSNPEFGYQQPTPEQKQAYLDNQEKTLAEYRTYLAELKVDPVASKDILNKVVDDKTLAIEVRSSLGANKPALEPKIDASKFVVTNDSSPDSIGKYATAALDHMTTYYLEASGSFDELYGEVPDPVQTGQAVRLVDDTLNTIYSLPVPKDAVDLQKSIVGALAVQKQTVENADAVARGVAARGRQWDQAYPAFAAAQKQVASVDKAVQELTKKYGEIPLYPETQYVDAATGRFVKVANAQFAVTIAGDFPRFMEQLLRSAIGAVVLNFAKSKITELVSKLESNYLIANFLYYGDAVAGKYVNNYLEKYITDPKDQQMIQAFIPQFNCKKTNQEDIRKALKAKSLEYLGFDPSVPLDTSDPKFYQKIIASNSLRGDSEGYNLFYNALAQAAKVNAETAKQAELVSPGKKSPIDEKLNAGIVKSVSYITNKIQAGLNSLFNILPSNATTGGPAFGGFVVNVILGIVNQLIVKGAVTLKEQATCIQIPVVNPIIPGDFTPSTQPVTNNAAAACIQSPEACEVMIFEQQTQTSTTTTPSPT
jgi:hypothetical protein